MAPLVSAAPNSPQRSFRRGSTTSAGRDPTGLCSILQTGMLRQACNPRVDTRLRALGKPTSCRKMFRFSVSAVQRKSFIAVHVRSLLFAVCVCYFLIVRVCYLCSQGIPSLPFPEYVLHSFHVNWWGDRRISERACLLSLFQCCGNPIGWLRLVVYKGA